MRFHIYASDVCIGDEDANSEDSALTQYALRTGLDSIEGLTPILASYPGPPVLDFAGVTDAVEAGDMQAAHTALNALEALL